MQGSDGGTQVGGRHRYSFARRALTVLVILVVAAGTGGTAAASGAPPVEWTMAYGGADADFVEDAVPTDDGGFALVGTTRSSGGGENDFWLVKVDAGGSEQWARTYGGAGYEIAHAVVNTPDGGFLLAGQTATSGVSGSNGWVVKTDAAGNRQWDRSFDPGDADGFQDAVALPGGGYVLAGHTRATSGAPSSGWLVKVDAAGNQEWARTYGGPDGDFLFAATRTADGGYALAGLTPSGSGHYDGWVVKTDASGVQQWERTYDAGGGRNEFVYSVVEAADGSLALAGVTSSVGTPLHTGDDGWLVKTDATGVEEWQRTYGTADGVEGFQSALASPDGGFVLGGYTTAEGAGRFDGWVVKVDATGVEEWRATAGTAGQEIGTTLLPASDGGHVLAGRHLPDGGPSYDGWLAKLGLTNAPPEAALSVSPAAPDEGEPVTLDASASTDPDGDPLSFAWDLDGDGAFDDATGATVVTTFPDDGTFAVAVRVTDGDGGSDVAATTVAVSNVAPTVTATGDAIEEGGVATVSALVSDPGADAHAASVDWGDGTGPEPVPVSGGAVTATHAYVDDGTFAVTVTVEDDDGGVGTATTAVTVANAPPVVVADASPGTVEEGESVSLTATFVDPGPLDTHAATVDWGDGTVEPAPVDQAAGTLAASHEYADDGSYVATVTLVDDGGAVGSVPVPVEVANVAPAITALAVDGPVEEGNPITATGTFADPGLTDVHVVTVDWGDGTVDVADVTQGPGGGSFAAAHTYADDGTLAVTVTVRDDDGGSTVAAAPVVVSNVAPSIADLALDGSGAVGEPVSLTATVLDPGADDVLGATVDWGDGTAEAVAVTPAPGGGSLVADHAYAAGGRFAVTLTVTDGDGGIGTATASVAVAHRVDVEIRPRGGPPLLNPRSRGPVTVAILGDEHFDASTVRLETLRFGPSAAVEAGGGAAVVRTSLVDVDGDGDLDLLASFRVADAGFAQGDVEAMVAGETDDGVALVGTGPVRLVPPAADDRGPPLDG